MVLEHWLAHAQHRLLLASYTVLEGGAGRPFVLPALATVWKEACLQGLVLSLPGVPHFTLRVTGPPW